MAHRAATDAQTQHQADSNTECSPSDHEGEHVVSLWNQFQTRRKACAWTADPKLFAQVMTETSLKADPSQDSSDVHILAKRHVTDTIDRCVRVRDRNTKASQTGRVGRGSQTVEPRQQIFTAARYCDTLPLSAYSKKNVLCTPTPELN